MFRLKAKKDETKVILNATSLLLKVAEADQTITTDEIKLTKEIICDFFDVDPGKIDLIKSYGKDVIAITLNTQGMTEQEKIYHKNLIKKRFVYALFVVLNLILLFHVIG